MAATNKAKAATPPTTPPTIAPTGVLFLDVTMPGETVAEGPGTVPVVEAVAGRSPFDTLLDVVCAADADVLVVDVVGVVPVVDVVGVVVVGSVVLDEAAATVVG